MKRITSVDELEVGKEYKWFFNGKPMYGELDNIGRIGVWCVESLLAESEVYDPIPEPEE